MLVALVLGCSSAATRKAAEASPAPSLAASSVPVATPLSGPTPSAAAVSPVAFACRLPLLRQVVSIHSQAGMLTFPAGTFTPSSNAPASPGYYDVAVSKWLPVGRGAVAPDGLHYAFMTGGSPSLTPGPPRLHIVSAATGVERVLDLALSDSQPYGVEDYAADAVYIGSGWEGAVFGHWRVDPGSGGVVLLAGKELLLDDGTGHAWRTVFDPRDPAPVLSAMDGKPMSNEVVRRNLKSGVDEVWFYHPGLSVAIAGHFVGGGLLVWGEAAQGPHQYWLVTAPSQARLVTYLDGGSGSIADVHGVWMGGLGGLYLFTKDGDVRRVSDVYGEPAHGCL